METAYTTQNDLVLKNLLKFYKIPDNLNTMLKIINGSSNISLRIVDWFATNYAKSYFTCYDVEKSNGNIERFKVYNDYKLKLRAYQKKRFDPFCRWDRILIPYPSDKGKSIQTTIGQLNFFKWAIENKVIDYIENNYNEILKDMNSRNSTSKKKQNTNNKTRKKRQELSVSAVKSIKKEEVEIILKFN